VSKKVLIFTYYWPPAGGVAVQRFLKFSKFLPEFGWEPIIITVNDGSYPYYDESLVKEIAPSLRVYRTKTFEPFELYNLLRGKKGKSMPLVTVGANQSKTFFQRLTEYIRANYFVPDARKAWVPYAVKQAEEILRTEKIDAIITTGPPHSAHLIGLKLKEKFGVKWIADFRDPWTAIVYNEMLPRTESTRQKDIALETAVLKTADHVVVISPGMKEQFENKASKIDVIFNGYDEDNFSKPFEPATGSGGKEDYFTIRYIGNLMASQNPVNLWKAIAELRSTMQAKIKLEFTGRVDGEIQSSIAANGLGDIATYNPFTEQQKAINLTRSASLLLFAIFNLPNTKLVITGKIFEYLASCSEIISFGATDGDASAILKSVGRKPMIEFNDYAETLSQLQAAYTYWQQNGQAFKYTDRRFEIYTRRNQAGALAGLLNNL
jgi:glycosyltransferase involved in cell wall biosynthesis